MSHDRTATVAPVEIRRQVLDGFAAKGSATIDVDDRHVDLARSIARSVGRDLGRPVRTAVSTRGPLTVTAWLADWPATVEEGIRHAENQRTAVASVA